MRAFAAELANGGGNFYDGRMMVVCDFGYNGSGQVTSKHPQLHKQE